MKKYNLVYCDWGETCDGHVRSAGVYDTEDEARSAALEDMRQYVDDHTIVLETSEIAQPEMDDVKLECWTERGSEGCCWTVLEIDI